LSTEKTRIERSTSVPRPIATSSACTYTPLVLPKTVMTAVRLPYVSALLMVNSTLGPGMTMMTNATAVNVSSRSRDTMGGR
jgi:hypothetical protein